MEKRGNGNRKLRLSRLGIAAGFVVLFGVLAVFGMLVAVGLLCSACGVWLFVWSRNKAMVGTRRGDNSLIEQADVAIRATRRGGKRVCLLLVAIQTSHAAPSTKKRIMDQAGAVLRDKDRLISLPDNRLAILTAAQDGLHANAMMAVARRVQTALEMPQLPAQSPTLKTRAAIGLASAPRPSQVMTAPELIQAANDALEIAEKQGLSGIFCADPLPPMRPIDTRLVIEAQRALDTDQIVPWFQPQICTRSGRLIGVESLARWEHPERGLITPCGFLPALEQARVASRLSEVMLHHGFAAMKSWDDAGINVPFMAINLSGDELGKSGLAQQIAWDLDAHNMAPERLRVEILETVAVASAEGTAGDNIAALRALGCLIDLDDFGTGHATIAAVEQFGVDRLKIDKSFISAIDKDPRQQKLVGAIIAMAGHMGLDTLAEGLETQEELEVLTKLGCGFAQGYAIARPMPKQDLLRWAQRRSAFQINHKLNNATG